MEGSTILRVYNKCNYDIGVTLSSGQKPVVRKGSFLPMSVNDILYIESTALRRRPFSSKSLVAMSDNGDELTLEDIGGYTDTYAEKHYDEDEIAANFKKPAKAVEAWLNSIEDPIELHAIAEIAMKMDLPGSKLKLIQAKVPNIDLLNKEE